MRKRTLQNLVADVRWQGDTEPATVRHTDKEIVRALNQSQQAFRLLISEAGHPYYCSSEVSTISAGADNFTPAATDIVSILGLDLLVNGELREVFPFQFSERNRYQSALGDSQGIPTYYRWQGDAILLMPGSDAQYTYRLWYLPTGSDLAATYDASDMIATSSSEFDGIAGWEDWLVLDTCLRLTTRDANISDNFELLQSELARVQARIVTTARKRTRNGPARRLDTRGRRLGIEGVNRWRLP